MTTNWSKVKSAAAGGGIAALVKAAKKRAFNVVHDPAGRLGRTGQIMKDFTKIPHQDQRRQPQRVERARDHRDPAGPGSFQRTRTSSTWARATPKVREHGPVGTVQSGGPGVTPCWPPSAANGKWFDDYGGYVAIGCDTSVGHHVPDVDQAQVERHFIRCLQE